MHAGYHTELYFILQETGVYSSDAVRLPVSRIVMEYG